MHRAGCRVSGAEDVREAQDSVWADSVGLTHGSPARIVEGETSCSDAGQRCSRGKKRRVHRRGPRCIRDGRGQRHAHRATRPAGAGRAAAPMEAVVGVDGVRREVGMELARAPQRLGPPGRARRGWLLPLPGAARPTPTADRGQAGRTRARDRAAPPTRHAAGVPRPPPCVLGWGVCVAPGNDSAIAFVLRARQQPAQGCNLVP